MARKLLYGIPTYSQFDACRKAVETIIDTSTLVPDMFLIVDNSETGAAADALTDLAQKYIDRVSILIRRENILSGAWNDIMHVAKDLNFEYVIIANDDVTPHTQSIHALVDAAEKDPSIAMWNGSGHSGNSYSFFLLQQWAYDRIGPFDENFKPAYFEDNDYDRRKDLLGLIRETLTDCTFDHVGSATRKAMSNEQMINAHARFVSNERYYMRKWAGMPGKEKFKIPFERPFFDLADA